MRVVEANIEEEYLDADAVTHFGRLTGGNDASVLRALNDLIAGLKTDGIWTNIAILCVAHGNSTDSLLNLKGNGTDNDSTISTGSPAFTANLGFACDSTNYIAINETETSLSNFVQHDGHIMAYRSTAGDGVRYLVRLASTGYTSLFHNSANIFMACQNNGGPAVGIVSNTGFFAASVTAIDVRPYITPIGAGTDTDSYSYTLQTYSGLIGTAGSETNTEVMSTWGAGAGLAPTELANYKTRIDAYMAAIG